MNLYDTIMKGPPRWAKLFALGIIILVVGVQIGIYRGRLLATSESIGQVLQAKDREMGLVKLSLDDARRERDKYKTILAIINCESGVKHDGVWGDGGRSYGIAQFQYRTFDWMRKEAKRPELRWKNRNDQLWLLAWALEQGYGKYWSCYKSSRQQIADSRQ